MKKFLLVFSFVVLTGFVALAGEEVGISCTQAVDYLGNGDFILYTHCDNNESYIDAFIDGVWHDMTAPY